MTYSQEEVDRVFRFTKDCAAAGMARRGAGFDWEGFINRVEFHSGVHLGTDMTSPFIKRIKEAAKKAWREANQ